MIRPFILLLITVSALTSCSILGIGKKDIGKIEQEKNPFGATGIPPQLRASTSEGGTPVKPGGNAPENKVTLPFSPDEDLVFTDPDNPNAEIPELSSLLSQAKRGPWETSETIAKKLAMREGKPLLIWFTDSEKSPMCKAISQELFSTRDFGIWADEKIIRLRVDAAIKVDDPDIGLDEKATREVEIRTYVAGLKKRYKILGQPSLIMLGPNGEVIGRYRGYKRGDADFTWGLIKQGEAAATYSHKQWQKELEKKGYREWQDRQERKVFAKLTNYSKGMLSFIEPDGTRSRTSEVKLSDKDRAWIAEQKKIRNME